MIDGALPAAIALATLALMLGFASSRTAALGLLLAGGAMVAASLAIRSVESTAAAIPGCWIAVVVLTALIYRPMPIGPRAALGLALATGLIAGAAVGSGSLPRDYYGLAIASVVVVPARIAVMRDFPIAPRVVASWLVAVALLAAFLPHAVTHPGYVPEHRA